MASCPNTLKHQRLVLRLDLSCPQLTVLVGVGATDAWNIVGLPADCEDVGQALGGSSSSLVRIGDDKVDEVQSKLKNVLREY
jgi:hypothetical protein